MTKKKERDAARRIITTETHCHRHRLFRKPCLICKLERMIRDMGRPNSNAWDLKEP